MIAKRFGSLSLLSGALISVQARANGELSYRLDSAPQAALVSFSSGLFFITIYAIFSPAIKEGIKRLKSAVSSGEIPKIRLLAGSLGEHL